jgi:hypothetical protein
VGPPEHRFGTVKLGAVEVTKSEEGLPSGAALPAIADNARLCAQRLPDDGYQAWLADPELIAIFTGYGSVGAGRVTVSTPFSTLALTDFGSIWPTGICR